MKHILSAGLLTAALFTAGVAQAQPFMLEANGARVNHLTGGEFGLGYSFANEHFRITPIVGAFVYQGDNDRYRRETFSNGSHVCRDTSNGQFADKDDCDNTAVKAYGKLEGAVRFKQVEIGGGVRLSSKTAPYGLASVAVSEQFALKAFAGDDYYGAGLSLRF